LIVPNNALIRASTIAKITAFQNHPTSNHSRRLLASMIINTVMIHPTNHKVNQFNGKVRKRKINPTVLFSNAMTTATISAHQKLSTSTPGITYAAIATAAHMRRNCIIRFMIRRNNKKMSSDYFLRKFNVVYFLF
jgi:hypothetical protein